MVENYYIQKKTFQSKQYKIPMKIVNIMEKETHDNWDKPTSNAKRMNYDAVKSYVNEHKDELMKKGSRHQINVLTEFGWRSSKQVGKGYSWADFKKMFYNPEEYYDNYAEESMEVFAIQILEW